MNLRRYPGVKPFEADERDRFFGRDGNIRDLYGTLQLEKLLVLYGKSGFGKSSLLNAGILPRFQDETQESGRRYQPVVVRFGAYDPSKKPPAEEVALRLEEIAKPVEASVFLEKIDAPHHLWYHFKRRQEPQKRQFLLVFDQFEEFFSYPLPQQERFAEEVAELIYTDIPQDFFEHFDHLDTGQQEFLSKALDVKAIFAIRSDRLHLLDQLKERLPAILHKRYELKALSRSQAEESIVNPAKLKGDFVSSPFEYLPDTIATILNRLSQSEKGLGATGIEAFQLQILCQYIEDKVLDGLITDHNGDGMPDVAQADLPDLNAIYANYYKRRLAELPPQDQLPARLLIENGLLFVDRQSGDARRLSVDGQALVGQFEHRGANQHLLGLLEKTYLVRRELSSAGGYNYEISHDTLIAPVLDAKRLREAEEQQEALARQVEAERAEAERRTREAEAKLHEESQRRAEAEQLQQKAEAGRRRANIFTVIALLFLFASIGAIWFANRARRDAIHNLNRFREEQLKRDLTEMQELISRGDDLFETNYRPSARALYERADSIAQRHPDNALLRNMSDSIQVKIKASQ